MTSDQGAVSWRVELQGEETDLKQLPARFSGPRFSVLEEHGSFYLVSSDFAGAEGPSVVNTRANELVRTLNLIVPVTLPRFRPVRTGAIVRISPSGVDRTLIIGEAHIRASAAECAVIAVLIGPDGKLKHEPIPNFDHEFAAATRDPHLAEALSCYPGAGFVELWKCFEIIRHHAGQLLKDRTTKTERSSFKQACQPQRHARYRGQRSSSLGDIPMSIDEARVFLKNLLFAWMQQP